MDNAGQCSFCAFQSAGKCHGLSTRKTAKPSIAAYIVGLYGGFLKMGVPNSWKIIFKRMIKGYPYFRKPPYD